MNPAISKYENYVKYKGPARRLLPAKLFT